MVEHWQAQLGQALTQPSTVPRIIIIHPHLQQPHRALQSLPPDTLYLRFDGTKLDNAALEQQFSAALGDATLKRGHVVVLDEIDRADPKQLAPFIADFLLKKVKQACLVLLTRTVPLELLRHKGVNGYIQFVPSDDSAMLTDYTKPPNAAHRLEVWAFGSGYALINGEEIANWDGLLPKMLFYFLVDRGMVLRPDIFKVFWHELPAKEATNVFHVTKRKVNELLNVDLTIYESSFYRVNPEIDLRYDILLFNQYLQESEGAQGEARRELLLKAVSLYRAPLLHNLNYAWARNRRVEMSEAYADALRTLGDLCQENSSHAEAFTWYLRAFHQQPKRGEVVAHILRLGGALGYYDNAKAIYWQYLDALNGDAPQEGLADLYAGLG